MKTRYLMSCAMAAIMSGFGGSAIAAAADAAASATSSDTAVGEVIVTATRRSESLQNVPQTVQAFGEVQLQQLNVTNLNSLLQYTPNVTFANNGPGQGNIYMRGLSAGFAGNQSSATISPFPNVALYLDDMSMQFPSRNVDVYAVDLERVEVLEGPQGTLFGGGAEAGALRYITNKPKLDGFEASAEAQYGWTTHGSDNQNGHFMINLPLLEDKLAVRLVFYDDHQGGYIDNVPSTFTRSNSDLGNHYLNILPSKTTGLCPNGLAPSNVASTGGYCTLANAPQANNYSIAANDQNPATYQGLRAELLYKINEDWNVLITESLQNLDAEGVGAEEPTGSDFQKLAPLQETSFSPSYDKDNFESTSWTVNGKAGPLKLVYTGGYMYRHIDQQQDYTNYARGFYGVYYQCSSSSGLGVKGTTTPTCYSPVSYWNDQVKNTHFTQEFRVSTPDDWRLRGIAGVYYESFRIHDDMNFDYKSIPSCTPANLALALANPNDVCVADVTTAPGATSNVGGQITLPDNTAFGEDTQRGYNQEAAFVSLDFDIIPHVLTITGGTRYFQYNEFETGSQYETGANCVDVPNGECVGGSYKNIDSHNDRITYHGFKSRAGVNWHINDRTLAYFLWSQGFRPGAFNRAQGDVAPLLVNASGAAVPVGEACPSGTTCSVIKQFDKPNGYAPDSLTNYEIGLKTELFDRRLVLNLSAYDMDWDNVQLVFFNPAALGNTSFGVNGPNYNVKGVEAQVVGRIMPGLTAQGSATYNHETQTTSPCLIANLNGNGCITELYSSATGMNGSFENPFGAVGTTPAFAPQFQGNLRLHYEWTMGNYKPYCSISGQYTGSMYNQPATYSSGAGVLVPGTTLLRYYQPGYATADISVGVRKDKWYAEVYSNNLFDSHASQFTSSAQFIESMVPLRPRIIMLKVGASF